jgi:bacterioferritin (cytochrome b1)
MFLGKSGFFFANENLPQDIIDNISSSININLAIIIIGSTLLFVFSYMKIKREYFIYIFTLISFVDLYLAGVEFNQNPTNPKEKYTLNSELKNIFKVNPPDEIFRVNMRMYNPSYMAMNRSQGMIDKIMLVEGYNPLLLKRPVPRLSDKERIHDILNVKYEIGIDRKMNQPRFYERFDRFNHVWATNKIKTIEEKNILDEISKTDDNFREITWLEETPNINLNSDSLKFNFNIKEYSNDEISLNTNSNTNSMMVLSEIFFPAWKAYVDGTETKIYRADFALRAIELTAGNHEVVFKYESSSFFTGGMISLITLFSSMIFLIFYKNK